MKIVTIYGQQHKGNTYRLTQLLLSELNTLFKKSDTPEIKEFYVNGTSQCLGCAQCIMKDEELCPHREEIYPVLSAIEAADLIILASPNYCMNMSGQMKTFCDHMAYRWMAHRPFDMRQKTGAVISTAAGSGAGKVTKLLKEQLQWWSVGHVFRLPQIIWDMNWEDGSYPQMKKLKKKVRKTAGRIYKNMCRPRTEYKLSFLFFIMKNMHKGTMCPPFEREYWKEQHLI
ncbi:MAG TPA: NAD(P)H-dependent oxidoreductase [Lachnospiraceae bacterium]|nr:NAD(P)H-dependent oxidoreductase [Lachnospiraceae bacterium]